MPQAALNALLERIDRASQCLPLGGRERSSRRKAGGDTGIELRRDRVGPDQQGRQALATPERQGVHGGLLRCAVPPSGTLIGVRIVWARASLPPAFGGATLRGVLAELGVPAGPARAQGIKRSQQGRLVTLERSSHYLQETQGRVEAERPVQLHAGS